jgi:hypothetical protein
MLLYNLSTGETLGVSAGKQWTRIVMFEGSGRQVFVEKFYTPIININHVRQYLMQLTIDATKTDDEIIFERIIRQILKATEL